MSKFSGELTIQDHFIKRQRMEAGIVQKKLLNFSTPQQLVSTSCKPESLQNDSQNNNYMTIKRIYNCHIRASYEGSFGGLFYIQKISQMYELN